MSDSSRVQISYLKQTEKGTIPNSTFKAVRHTGGTFGMPQETQRSEEVRGDAQRGGAVRVGLNPEGSVSLELSAETFDDLIEGLMRSSWSTATDIEDSGIAADNDGSKFTGVNWAEEDITKGQWVHVAGFENNEANGWFKVESISETDLVVNPAPGDDSNTDLNTIEIKGSYIRNGTDRPYFAFQLQHLDLDDKFRLIRDARVGQMNLNSSARSRVTGSISFTGREMELPETKSGNGEVDDAPDTEVLNTSDHVTGIFINDERFEGGTMDFSIQANMNARRQNAVGHTASYDIGLGSLDLSGNISVYLSDSTWDDLLKKYRDFTKISLAFAFETPAGQGYVLEMPRIALTNEPGNIPGPDNDVMLNFDFEAEPGDIGDESKTIQICKR